MILARYTGLATTEKLRIGSANRHGSLQIIGKHKRSLSTAFANLKIMKLSFPKKPPKTFTPSLENMKSSKLSGRWSATTVEAEALKARPRASNLSARISKAGELGWEDQIRKYHQRQR